jgi:hypothetical protein
MFIESADIQHAYVQWLDAENFRNTQEGVQNINTFPYIAKSDAIILGTILY